MDDVVAVCCDLEMEDGSARRVWYLTWGRTFDSVDPAQLEQCVRARVVLRSQVVEARVRVCESLSAARDAKYFYEGLLHFARLSASTGYGTVQWLDEQRALMLKGKSMYLAGDEPGEEFAAPRD